MRENVSPPTGEVSFLLTDVVASTRRWEEDPAAARRAFELHAELTRASVEGHRGWLVKDTGDGFLAAFSDPADAVAAAVDVQRRLRAASWPGDPLQVRAGIHTGEAEPARGDYHAPAVNRCARVAGIAHGGQILATADTRRASSTAAHGGEHTWLDLGVHRLKDLDRAVRLFQVVCDDLPSVFPPLRSLTDVPNNLPHVATPLLGRTDDVAVILDLLAQQRVVTLTGAGGIGKTRLALQAAADALDRYDDGVWFVELGSVSDPHLVPATVASDLRLADRPGHDAERAVIDHLRDRRLLLVLDNCEHLIDAAARLAEDVVRACPDVTVLSTTREPLGLVAEHVHTVAPLATAPGAPAVELFLTRARAAGTAPPREDDLDTITTICRRLDGLPLAIELAAARSRILSPQEILDRLDERFTLLTGGSRTALPRQRTLEATVAWSYDLLPPLAQVLLRRLSVLSTAFTLQDAEAVCATDPISPGQVLELVAELADRSLLAVQADTSSRYRMLETIRAYARDRLVESSDEIAFLRGRHLRWASEQAKLAAGELDGPEQLAWVERVEEQLDDHRAAMRWAATNDQPALGASIAASLYRYWFLRGVREGRQWLDEFVGGIDGFEPQLAARVLFTHGSLLQAMGEYERSVRSLERAVAIYDTADDPRGLAYALHYLMRSSWETRPREERRDLIERALAIFRTIEEPVGIGLSLLFVAMDEYERGDFQAGIAVMRECDATMRRIGAPQLVAHGAEVTAWGLERQGDIEDAVPRYAEALSLYRQIENPPCSAHCLENVALLLSRHRPREAAVLLAATERLREEIGVPVPPYEDMSHEPARRELSGRLSEDELAEARREGAGITMEEALDRAMASVIGLR